MRYAGALLAISLLFFAHTAYADINTDQRAALQAQLDQIEKDIANNQGTLSVLQAQRTTLERDIAILNAKIKTAQLQIKQTDLTLSKLGNDISTKKAAIVQVDAKVSSGQESLAQILRRKREIDDTSVAQLALSENIGDMFQSIDEYEQVQKALGSTFTRLADARTDLAAKKNDLEDKQVETQQVRTAQVIAKQQVLTAEQQKQNILSTTKGQEKTYQQIIADKKKQAAAIREALFGLRDTGAIPFGTAYDYAKQAAAGTGVPPALVLAILTQESNLGVNTGSCYVTDMSTGSGVSVTKGKLYSNVMKAPRDTAPFQTIMDALGRDVSTTAVSCPQGVGYGGAMGPSQFIPSTWMLYKSRLTALTGESFPDPWSARTAIYATALLMKDNGGDGGTRESARRAALKYFAGSNWNKPGNSSYGTSVLNLMDKIQAEIDILSG